MVNILQTIWMNECANGWNEAIISLVDVNHVICFLIAFHWLGIDFKEVYISEMYIESAK